jgi:ribosomal protein S18 acetylase RimI-like enzyme
LTHPGGSRENGKVTTEKGFFMEDERLAEKIEVVKQLLSETMAGAEVDYIGPKDSHKFDLHLFRVGRRPTDHRLWLGQDLLDDLAVKESAAWLETNRVPELFAATTEKQIFCETSLAGPRLIDRD